MNFLTPLSQPSLLPRQFRKLAIATAVVAVLAAPLATQAQMPFPIFNPSGAGRADIPMAPGALALSFAGSLSQIGLGIDKDGHVSGQLTHVLQESAFSATVAQAWVGGNGAGGLRLDYNWMTAIDGKAQANSSVKKVFAAVDRNGDGDSKATFGVGLERENWFGSVSLSRGLSDRRWSGPATLTQTTEQINGSEAGRPYIDTLRTDIATRYFQKGYEQGIGLRLGYLYPTSQVRVSVGLDHETGEFSARQDTLSLGVEKFFVGSPHSIGMTLEQYKKSGDYETSGDGSRLQFMYRYSFGGSAMASSAGWRSAVMTREVQVPASPIRVEETQQAMPPTVQTRTEFKIVKTTASMTSDAFFALDKSELTATAKSELDRVAEVLKTSQHSGNIKVSGHTCDLGSAAYNLKLSLRRAEAVRDYLVARSGLAASMFVTEGMGESQPKYPNTKDSREKNRRVDLEFIQYQDRKEAVQVPVKMVTTQATSAVAEKVQWKTEVIEQEPTWVRRALRHAVPHKQNVDSYRGAEITRNTTTTRAYVNRPPVAQDDVATVQSGVATPIAVLANDSDPDGNPLRIASVTAPANGTATVVGNTVVYTSNARFGGTDAFSYTVEDGAGGSTTARVTVTVQRTNQPPVANTDQFTGGSIGTWRLPVLANDTDPDGDALSIVSFTQPAAGVVAKVGNELTFTPFGPFTINTFTYTIQDTFGATSTATVILIDP